MHWSSEYAPSFKSAVLENVTVRGVKADYIHTARTARAEKQTVAAAAETAKEATNRRDVSVIIRRVDVLDSTFGYVDKTRRPEYRVFLSDARLMLAGLTNQSADDPARVTVTGKFMGTGHTEATATFRPSRKGGDLDLRLAVENADLVGMNDLLRAYGKFDVAAGELSVYMEARVRNGEIQGYVKPLFKDVVVHSPDQDRDKSVGQRLKEKVIGGVAKVLKNRPRREVATEVPLSGRIDKVQTSVLQIVARLLENAFVKAILPGFDRYYAGRGEGSG